MMIMGGFWGTAPVFAGVRVFDALPELAERTGRVTDPDGLYPLPVQRYSFGDVAKRVFEGARERTAWAVPIGSGVHVYQLFQALVEELEAEGYTPLLQCGALDCGGFDFRRAIDLLPPPVMFFDLSEFYVLTASRKNERGTEDGVMLVVSRAARDVTCQLTRIGHAIAIPTPEPAIASPKPRPVAPIDDPEPSEAQHANPVLPDDQAGSLDIAERLQRFGNAVLEDVKFAPGGSQLDATPKSLTDLAAFLADNPDSKAMIVGHSDSSGSASANLALSKRRAGEVRRLLIDRLGVPAARVSADGVGHLAPRDTNATDEGMARNRRVEVVLY